MSVRSLSPWFRVSLFTVLLGLVLHAEDEPVKRVSDGLLALYEFDETEGSVVNDSAGAGRPLNLKIEKPNRVQREDGRLEIKNGTLIKSDGPAAKINKSVRRRSAFTMEAWLTPAKLDQKGPARILTISGNSSNRNVTLGQEGDQIVVRFRSTKTSSNGLPSLDSRKKSLRTERTHVAYVWNPRGEAQLYLNGKREAKKMIGGKASNWDEAYRLAMGDEVSGGRPWLGSYHLVAVYGKALSADEICLLYTSTSPRDKRQSRMPSSA